MKIPSPAIKPTPIEPDDFDALLAETRAQIEGLTMEEAAPIPEPEPVAIAPPVSLYPWLLIRPARRPGALAEHDKGQDAKGFGFFREASGFAGGVPWKRLRMRNTKPSTTTIENSIEAAFPTWKEEADQWGGVYCEGSAELVTPALALALRYGGRFPLWPDPAQASQVEQVSAENGEAAEAYRMAWKAWETRSEPRKGPTPLEQATKALERAQKSQKRAEEERAKTLEAVTRAERESSRARSDLAAWFKTHPWRAWFHRHGFESEAVRPLIECVSTSKRKAKRAGRADDEANRRLAHAQEATEKASKEYAHAVKSA